MVNLFACRLKLWQSPYRNMQMRQKFVKSVMNNPYYSKILPGFLIENGGLNSGFMMPQYASAALVNGK